MEADAKAHSKHETEFRNPVEKEKKRRRKEKEYRSQRGQGRGKAYRVN